MFWVYRVFRLAIFQQRINTPMTETMENLLVLVRHGQSEWNLKNLFTGWKNPDLTAKGVKEAHKAGQDLKEMRITFDKAFTSDLSRAQRTLNIILDELGQSDLPVTCDQALNERDYGDLTGMNKDEARDKFGEDQVHIWRRSFDVPPPGGESLKMTAERVLPYFTSTILPEVTNGKNVIIAAHGNSLRALVMELENLSSEDILKREIATGDPIVYRLNEEGRVIETLMG
jgi:2,3-bisphosphoglycerate-dependent phosphoglycerate mutase